MCGVGFGCLLFVNVGELVVLLIVFYFVVCLDVLELLKCVVFFVMFVGKWYYWFGVLFGEGGNGVVFWVICDEMGYVVVFKLMCDDVVLVVLEWM